MTAIMLLLIVLLAGAKCLADQRRDDPWLMVYRVVGSMIERARMVFWR